MITPKSVGKGMVDRTSGGYNTVLCNQVFLPRLQSSRENTVDNSGPNYRPITILIATGLMLSISMGIRQVFGLFVQPMVKDLGLTLSDLTLAISIQNLAWGILQPFSGALVGRFGFRPILLAGAALYVAGLGILSAANGTASVMLGAGVLVGASLACTGSAISQAVASRATSGPRRSIVLGLIVGVGSLGALAAAPLGQSVTNVYGWRAGVLAVLALASLLFPAAWVAGRVDRIPLPDTASRNRADKSALAAMRLALHRPAFLVMTTAYFVCGMQLLFKACSPWFNLCCSLTSHSLVLCCLSNARVHAHLRLRNGVPLAGRRSTRLWGRCRDVRIAMAGNDSRHRVHEPSARQLCGSIRWRPGV